MQPACHSYEPNPRYAAVGGGVAVGWDQPVARLPDPPLVLAVDGPALLDWDAVVDGLCRALAARGAPTQRLDLRSWFAPWPQVLRATASPALLDDPHFDRLAGGDLADLLGELPPSRRPAAGVLVAFGPAAALLRRDVLWYVDRPKRFAEADVVAGRGHNLGQRPGDGPATTKRLFYSDWPLRDRHRDAIAPQVDRWFDVQVPERPTSLDGRAHDAPYHACPGPAAVPDPPHVQLHPVGWPLGAAATWFQPGRGQRRVGLRASSPPRAGSSSATPTPPWSYRSR